MIPKISIIIPVYNAENYLRECLDSIINQTLKEIEVICIDDGSSDSSVTILYDYQHRDDRITIINQLNSGSGIARNKGIERAKGEFITFIDSNDYYPTKNTLEKMYNKAKEKRALICGGEVLKLKNQKYILNKDEYEAGYIFEKEGFIEYKDYQFDYGCWRFIYNLEFINHNNLRFPNYVRQEDPIFFIKAMHLAKKFYALKEETYVYRAAYKTIQWDTKKVIDMFSGISDCLDYSSDNHLEILHCTVCNRLNSWTFQKAVADTIFSKVVRNIVVETLNKIDFSILARNNIQFQFADIFSALLKESKTGVLVSIIVPVYNVDKYLSKCLDSLINQTIDEIEILCINDGSTDNSKKILEDYANIDKRIKIFNKPNGGLSSARNFGIRIAQGSYVLFVDSDDWIEKDTLEKALSKMYCKVDVVSWGAKIINEGLDELNERLHSATQYHRVKLSGEKELNDDIILSSTITVWNKLLKLNIIKRYGLVFTEGRLFEDNDFMIKYFLHSQKCYYLNEYLYNYVQRPNSIMEKVRNYKSFRTIDQLFIFDSIYKHLLKYNLLKEHKKLLTSRYIVHLSQAYKYAPSSCKTNIREKASVLANEYNDQYFNGDTVNQVKNRNYLKVKELNEFIVSLTSYPKRIDKVHLVIMSIIDQSVKPDKIILWLAESQFPNLEKDLPNELIRLKANGLTIKWCEDIKSYKKLIPVLKESPESIIITADDDVIYDKNWLKYLIESYLKNPYCIHCHRAYKITLNNGIINPYSSWKKWHEFDETRASYLIFFTGVGGVLYPPHCFNNNIFSKELFEKLCPNGDDIWFWGNAILAGVRIKVVSNALKYPKLIDGSQEVGLWHENVINKDNDKNINALLEYYPNILSKINEDMEVDDYINKIIEQKNKLELNITKINKDLNRYKRNYNDISKSKSYKIGRSLTYIPRKIRGCFRCYTEHGLKYTLKRIYEHLLDL